MSIPLIIQHDPVLTGVDLSPEFLAKMISELTNVRYIKLEVPQSPYKIAKIREMVGDSVGVFGGMGGIVFLEELERGACGTMSSAALLELSRICDLYRSGRYEESRTLFYECLPYINFEIQLPLRNITKEVLCMAGIISSPYVRHP